MAKLIGGTTVEGLLTVDSNIETDEGDVILDSSTNTLTLGVLPTGSGNGLDADLLDGKHAGAFALDGHNHDGSYILEAGDTMTGVLTLSDGSTAASRSWVDGNADVPNADFADSAGDADTVDGSHASAFAASGHLHDSRYLETAGDSMGGQLDLAGNNVVGGEKVEYNTSGNDFWRLTDGSGGSNTSPFTARFDNRDMRYYAGTGGVGTVLEMNLDGSVNYPVGPVTINGSTAATQSWVNGNADVPNADYADNAGDADTVDGLHGNDLSKAQSSASFTSTDTTTDINKTSWTQIPWDVQKNIDAPYTHDPANSPEQITFDEAGTYQVYVSLSYDSTDSYRTNPAIKFAINGTRRNAMGLSGYVRNSTGHAEGSNNIMETISVSAGDTLTVQTYQYANSGTCTMRSEESTLEISSITTRTLSMSDADTVDGQHASSFLLSSGDTMTGELKANAGIRVNRGGLDANNSIESKNGDWLGLDSDSTGSGVLVGYYNAPEVRLGNGGVQVTANGDDVTTSSVKQYDIQKNGSDTTGVINFKT